MSTISIKFVIEAGIHAAWSCPSAFRDWIVVCLDEFAVAFYVHKHQLTDVMWTTDIFKGVKGTISKILRSCSTKMTMIYLQGLIGLLIITSESAATEPGSEISHFQNSLPVLLEQPQLLSYFQLLSDGWWCECHKKFCSPANKANGRLLECLAFDIFPLHLMFLLSSLINVTLIFMSVAVHHKLCCKLLMLETSKWNSFILDRSWQKSCMASCPCRKACSFTSSMNHRFSSLTVHFNPGQILLWLNE